MTALTLNLTPWQYYRLRDSLEVEANKWEKIKLEAENGTRPNASPEGAEILIADTLSVLDQLKAWAAENPDIVS